MKQTLKLGLTLSAMAFLTACGTGGAQSASGGGTPAAAPPATLTGGANGGAVAEAPLSISWMTILHTAAPPTDYVINRIEAATNTNLEFLWVPDASRQERMTTALAAQELGDIVTFTQLQDTTMINAMEAGMFWELTDKLDYFPNLSQISEARRRTASREGRLYGVPLERWATRRGFTLRQDWLDNLGLEVPTTMDELFEVARAFTTEDTFGFIGRTAFIDMSFANTLTMFGGPNRWRLNDDGTFTHAFETTHWVENMQWWRAIVEGGYINPDFLTTPTSDQNQLFAQGRGGMYPNLTNIGLLRDLSQGMHGDDFALVPVNRISRGDGNYGIIAENNGVGGLLSIPRTNVQTEEHLMQILAFIDRLFDYDVHMYITGGVRGTHWDYTEEGAFEVIDTQRWQEDVQPLGQNVASVVRIVPLHAHPEMAHRDRLFLDNEEIVVMNPAIGLNSPTFNERGSTLEQAVHDVTVQYIMGVATMANFEAALETFRNNGGRQIAQEFEESNRRFNQ